MGNSVSAIAYLAQQRDRTPKKLLVPFRSIDTTRARHRNKELAQVVGQFVDAC